MEKGKEVDSPKDEAASLPGTTAPAQAGQPATAAQSISPAKRGKGAKRTRRKPIVHQETTKMSPFQLEEALERLRVGSAPADEEEEDDDEPDDEPTALRDDLHQRRTISGERPVVRPDANTSGAVPVFQLPALEQPVEENSFADVTPMGETASVDPDIAAEIAAEAAGRELRSLREATVEPAAEAPARATAASAPEAQAPGSAVGLILVLVATAAVIAAVILALEPKG